MNKIGGVMLISIMVGLMIFISGMLFLNFLKTEVTLVRNSDNLDCSNASGITDGNKMACLIVDILIPYFIILIISFSGGIIAGRFLV